MRVAPMGPNAVLVIVAPGEDVGSLWSALRLQAPMATEEVVAGAESVLVVSSGPIDPAEVTRISETTVAAADGPAPREHLLDVDYQGPDLLDVAAETGLTPGEVVARHVAAPYRVAFRGFSPGFPYLSGGDPALRVPRHSSPRRSVATGSVGLAAEWTGIYPRSTPGGWRIIGVTGATLFDPSAATPALLAPGDRVRFRAGPRRAIADAPSRATRPAVAKTDHLRVIDPGPFTTVQDQGRPGWAHLGVSRAGAADRRSAAYANSLVGNEPGAAVLEATLGGPLLRLGSDRVLAVTGARAELTVDGLPARQDAALALRAGCEIRLGRFRVGTRAYIAVQGGLDVEPVLGSRSTDTLSGLGPAVVGEGDVLPLGAATSPPPRAHRPPPGGALSPAGSVVVHFHPGPAYGIGAEIAEELATADFLVGSSSDRTGVRLEGTRPLVSATGTGELPSHGVVAGAVQVPPSGFPIVLMRNHPTTGGYPVAAIVDQAGVDLLAQCRPGTLVRFRPA